MATHFLNYKSVEGRWTACGRYFADNEKMPRGVRVITGDADVSCQSCLGSERLRIERAGRRAPATKIEGDERADNGRNTGGRSYR